MKLLFFIISVILIEVDLSAQYSFEFTVSTPVSERIIDVIEEESGSFLAVGYEGEINPQEDNYVGLIIRISKFGDTTIKRYSTVDTGYIFHKILRSYDNQYYIFGSSVQYLPDQDHNLIVIKMDTSLNIIWKKEYDFAEKRHYPMKVLETSDNGFYLFSIIVRNYIEYTFICRLDKYCDTIRSKVIYDGFGSNRIRDAVYSNDSSQFFLFGRGFGTGAASRVIYDTNYNLINNTFLPVKVHPHMQAKWITDTTLLFASGYFDFEASPQSDDIAITETDTSFTNMDFTFFSSEDTIDYTSHATTIDFINPDSIFLSGTHNQIIDFWPQGVSWVMLKQLNRNLVSRSELFFGGDAYYSAFCILATSDGGCLISAERYNYLVQNEEFDIFLIKLAKEDIITGNINEVNREQQNVLIYPNPGSNILNVRNPYINATFYLYESDGKLVKQLKINRGQYIIPTSILNPGHYHYRIISGSFEVSTGSWIKK